ncbi:adenylate/guanylate cyclase domain-containing protein [Rhizobium sp. Root1203]|uniref:adenylate/guanylate cyclase domain-containing protein n=1 Tax=Rhizobium sp. Root1203 TaxID=1736427 RepID=UPI0009EC862E|nr:adenylate/guanylate cyclase domain-containing protein [Rhizobium sp. Root1203]
MATNGEQGSESAGAADDRLPTKSPGSPWVRPLRLHLSVVIVTLLVCISAPLMWLTYTKGREAAVTAGEDLMRQLGLRAIDRYRNVFGDGYSAVATASVLAPLLTPPPADLDAKQEYFIKVLQSSPYIDGIYVGYPDGAFVQAVNVERNSRWHDVLRTPSGTIFALRTIEKRGDEALSSWRFLNRDGVLVAERSDGKVAFDPRARPWYSAAMTAGGQVSVGPYVSATTRSLSLTLAMPMARGNGVIVGADVLLEAISRLLNREAISQHGRGYVFDSDGQLIVHSDPEIMAEILDTLSYNPTGRAQATGMDDPAVEPIKALLAGSGNHVGAVQFMVGAEPYLAQISPVEFSGLLKGNVVVLAAPLDDFVGPSDRLLNKTLWIAGILVLVGIAAALVVARLVSNALFSLANEARQIGSLEELDGNPATHSWIAEINVLANALASARDAIHNFALYVPRELVRRIVNSGKQAVGTATRQNVTLLFTDIRDFTTISEQHSPEDVVDMLSEYFQLMNEIVERHNGVIIQYLGDSIFGMWNAPLADPNHVENGCRCALALKAAIDDWNAANRAAGSAELVTRFGLHTGVAVVGSVGAQSRRQYTAMGDTVNVASRLEGMNKQFGTSILASRAVEDSVRETFHFRALGLAEAKGRLEQIEIFELVGDKA